MLYKIFFWFVFIPAVQFIRVLGFWLAPVQKRASFESKNKSDKLSRSFKQDHIQADLAFEFSSEGEYQQVASLVQDSLQAGKKLELIFFSPSVEKAVMDLGAKHPEQLRYLRYPLLGFGFSQWMTAKELIMVRYDLFPEFLAWVNSERSLKMLWMSFKKDRVKGSSPSLLKRIFLKRFRQIIYASSDDQRLGKEMGYPGPLYDFRLEQISRRIQNRELCFQQLFPQYRDLATLWQNYPREKRLIIGNAWPSDMQIIKQIPSDTFVLVVPHILNTEVLTYFHETLSSLRRTPVEINVGSKLLSGNTFILNKKGILCELYADFGKAYVGGGFETSIHSVLEPLVAGADQIACGPLHHRSTEYDLARDYGDMTEVKTEADFYIWLNRAASGADIKSGLKSLINQYPEFRREVISC